ncbi:MAG TPA: peptide chain release factor N(5)-glutamine methyltransferase [Solirubrobacterales bacterium]|nr:peptide chain release factor N(5)-glutamine methyltransferase [Solirubrobacterales bacterium]
MSDIREAIDAAVDGLRAAGVEDPRLDAEVMLAEATGYDRATLVADSGAELSPAASRAFGEMVRRRLRREPVAYIVGRKGFRTIEVTVDRRVLIPRPETELLIEIALERDPATLLDVGTGSGAIALAAAIELRDCEVTATDTSGDALEAARANAYRLGLEEQVRFLWGTLPPEEDFELILANLPYVAEPDWPTLQPEVREWEPREALVSGADGLDAIRALIPRLEVGTLALEVGEGQAEAVRELLGAAGFTAIETRLDLAGIERVVLGDR